jgi:transcriptional regulator with XRE-family HTH domain
MDDVRLGRALRALRLRMGLRQVDVAERAGVSQSAVSLAEQGHLDRLSIHSVRTLFGVVGGRFEGVVSWRGGELDRILDENHARLVTAIVRRLRRLGWVAEVEVTYSEYGERGSIDVLAGDSRSRVALVVEVKSDLVGVESTARKMDEKERLARRKLVRERFGWEPSVVGRLLVLPSTHTSRRKVGRFAEVLDVVVPDRGAAVAGWLRRPSGRLRGLIFVSDMNPRGAGHRFGRRVRVSKPRDRVA